jgi:ABC-2 type transport system ATP-binding protein
MTTITLTDVAIGTGLGAPVPPLTATIAPGVPTVLAVETDERPLLVSMLLGGRIRPDSGAVLIDGSSDFDSLRSHTALVDTPFVAEPAPGISLGVVVSEEFSFSKRAGGAKQVRRFLSEHGLAEYERIEVRALPATARVRIFCELALLRESVDTLILTSPERHGGAPSEWFSYLSDVAHRGISVAIITDSLTRETLLSLGAVDALAPSASTPAESTES